MKGMTRTEEIYAILPPKRRKCAPGGVPLEGTAVVLAERVGMGLDYARNCLADLVSAGMADYALGTPEDVHGKRPRQAHKNTRSFWKVRE